MDFGHPLWTPSCQDIPRFFSSRAEISCTCEAAKPAFSLAESAKKDSRWQTTRVGQDCTKQQREGNNREKWSSVIEKEAIKRPEGKAELLGEN
jgi:hypothetical protein